MIATGVSLYLKLGLNHTDQMVDGNLGITQTTEDSQTENQQSYDNRTIACLFYNEKDFIKSIRLKQNYEGLDDTVVGIIPHHLVASDMIAGFISGIANDTIETVVIIGPKHVKYNSKIVTSDVNWSTAFGTMEVDKDNINNLLSLSNINVNNNSEIMEADHAISSLIPYINKYMPQVKVIPILLGGNVTLEEIDILSDFLTEISKDNTMLVLGSIDFSHYLRSNEAIAKDVETKDLIKGKDYRRLKDLGDDHIDSPETLITLMKYIEKMNYEDLEFVDNSSSLEKIGLPENSEVFKDGLTTYMIYKSRQK
jgi:AmmeMemoRadiSam system protein B